MLFSTNILLVVRWAKNTLIQTTKYPFRLCRLKEEMGLLEFAWAMHKGGEKVKLVDESRGCDHVSTGSKLLGF